MSAPMCVVCGIPMRAGVDMVGSAVWFCDRCGSKLNVGNRDPGPPGSKGAHYESLQDGQKD